jgi:phosphatidylserine/phosphatidylglycerophosphate/cardiolipin synthase-like enzyme
MRKRTFFLKLLVILAACTPCSFSQAADVVLPGNTPARVCFSPGGGCTQAIVRLISSARSEILVQAFSFSSPALTDALLQAHERGVKVAVILDKSERMEGLTPGAILSNAGIPVYLDGKHAIANNRVIVIDRQILLTGSFNYNSASEEMNAENLLILTSKDLAALYRDNWQKHREHCEPY